MQILAHEDRLTAKKSILIAPLQAEKERPDWTFAQEKELKELKEVLRTLSEFEST
jgi:hypothetical protein